MIQFHKEMIRIRKDYPVFKTGSIVYLICEPNLIGIGRFNESEAAFTLIQIGGGERDVDVDVWRLGVNDGDFVAQMMVTDKNEWAPRAEVRIAEQGKIRVHLKENGGVVWKKLHPRGSGDK
jgi:alpha-glucosidase